MPKTIGILGGMSPESTVEYYRHIIRSHISANKDHNYPEIIIYSVSFEPITHMAEEGRWGDVAAQLGKSARKLEKAGADFIVIATNTMHLVYNELQEAVSIPILNLLDIVAAEVKSRGISRIGVLGTHFTMQLNLYNESMKRQDIQVITPLNEDMEYVNKVIYEELIEGRFEDSSRIGFAGVINRLRTLGAQGVILGCTEIPLLISEKDSSLPVFDTARIHAEAALDFAMRDSNIK
ncbi:MAG: aspartate/glutamate racemase family protein [Candidatus Electryonea clarkiae]|nr:aspartate/glutamate racemase family protein [Candidatus Electryonea clarkiae]MDP8288322.1 aspartate/glutamate racemase family protein [Candidatus Electryonea clarkiae]